mmetsp:Transcript_2713/g.7237  ORF Transcript_2713/g.7237 Transcript_2713/m.7237 type:complete len:299 (-) Transcript_2713:15011-15907(-)|eukprot:CAMPEP_0172357744 /NCGR_PEP_ID=MMETSP1060-20121228/2077_1 /TAXON_ID=37318 /ORGANISM="Pseudo-nitzschia pungens, Strain cf. cingulata" /LENGTH=298 /DNA_ID=CAMNT_0013078555 /DNA_START=1540 /DNA_END=2436 /DNA_ORIENTATION=-
MSTELDYLDDDVAARVDLLVTEFNAMEATQKAERSADGSNTFGLNLEDNRLLVELTNYKHYITSAGELPGKLSWENLQNVSYNPNSEYSKRTQSKKETYYSKFRIEYPLQPVITSKYVAVAGSYIDLMARAELINDAPNNYCKDYVSVYIPSAVMKVYKDFIEVKGYQVDAAGLNVDHVQSLVSMNANYATEEIPSLGIHRYVESTSEDGNVISKRVLDKNNNIEVMYHAIRAGGGAIFRGIAFGEFGVSKQVAIGAPAPVTGTTLKLTFKLIGFHAFSKSESVNGIRTKGTKMKRGV